jgi:pimeloyl-ACP methyl ester carboxylesterase
LPQCPSTATRACTCRRYTSTGTTDRPNSPAFIRPLAARSDDWRLELLEGVGHFILDEAPERVEHLVRAFLSRP